ncbi:hypothetical protein VULLAG_LOCUS19627 [Vulpes lagopus]
MRPLKEQDGGTALPVPGRTLHSRSGHRPILKGLPTGYRLPTRCIGGQRLRPRPWLTTSVQGPWLPAVTPPALSSLGLCTGPIRRPHVRGLKPGHALSSPLLCGDQVSIVSRKPLPEASPDPASPRAQPRCAGASAGARGLPSCWCHGAAGLPPGRRFFSVAMEPDWAEFLVALHTNSVSRCLGGITKNWQDRDEEGRGHGETSWTAGGSGCSLVTPRSVWHRRAPRTGRNGPEKRSVLASKSGICEADSQEVPGQSSKRCF